MRNFKRNLGVLCILVVFFGGCGIRDRWQFEPGLILADGFNEHTFSNSSGVLFTQNGHRRIRAEELRDISVYHVVIFISDNTVEPGASETSRSFAKTVSTLKWRSVGFDPRISKSLEFNYDGQSKKIVIGNHEFSTVEQNMFAVYVDSDWTISAIQLGGKVEDRVDSKAVLQKFKEISDLAEIRNLELAE